MNILSKIVKDKREVLKTSKIKRPLTLLSQESNYTRKGYSLRDALLQKNTIGIIAEFKRHSPSKGALNLNALVEEVVKSYETCGATGVSVLTESENFMAREEDIALARKDLKIPLLRKDFMIDPYQFHEAKAMGADVVLLIASILSPNQVKEFMDLAHHLEMEVILEIHNLQELEKTWTKGIDIVGVNNRDLTSFKIDIETSFRLAKEIPSSSLKISESGISDIYAAIKLNEAGFNGLLIGESFMKQANPGLALQEFLDLILSKQHFNNGQDGSQKKG